MKNSLGILLVGLMMAITTLAQNISAEPYLGINQTPLPSTALGTDYKMTIHGGILGKYHLSENLSINLGLGISDRRKQYHYSDTAFALEQYGPIMELAGFDVDEIDSTLSAFGFNFDEITNSYGVAKIAQLEIPVSLRYNYKKINFDLGGYVAFNVNVKKYERIVSDVPLLQAVDVNQIDSSGTISLFFPAAHSETSEISASDENITSFNYGLKLGVGYSPDSYLRFYSQFCFDLNDYAINSESNLLSNRKFFFRLGISYDIRSLWVNKENSKASFN